MIAPDSLFTIHRVEIKASIGERFTLIPFGDIHRFAPLCSVDRWFEFLKESKEEENPLFLGMGDYDDLASATERKVFNSGLHESTTQTIDDLYDKRVMQFAKEIEFMRGNLIGLVEGNHHGVYFSSGMTTTQKLAEIMRCKFLGAASFIRLSFTDKVSKYRAAKVDIFAHHGKGGSGRMVGSDMNHIQALADMVDAQILLMGHSHKKSIGMKTRLCLSDSGHNCRVAQEKVIMGRTGTFLRSYIDGESSYAAKACMSPTDLGTLKIYLTPKRLREGNRDSFYIDIQGSL